MRTDATRAFDFIEWRTPDHLAPHTLFAPGQRAAMCAAPLDHGAADAWLRSAFVEDGAPLRLLQELIMQQQSRLHALDVRSIWAVDVRGSWLLHALRERGFRKVDEIVTYALDAAVDVPDAAELECGRIASVAASHLPALAALDARAFAAPWRYPEFVLRAAWADAAVCAVHLENERVAGYVLGIVQNAAAHVVRLAVDPHFERRGIGGGLLRYAVRQVRAAGCTHVTLNTIASLPAGRLYRRLGFRPQHVGVDVLRMSWVHSPI